MTRIEKIEKKLLFTFNDTNKIKIGNNIHLMKPTTLDGDHEEIDWKIESILVAAEQVNVLIPYGISYCKINNQIYKVKNKLIKPYGAEIVEVNLLK